MSEQANEFDCRMMQNSQAANPTTHYNTPKQVLRIRDGKLEFVMTCQTTSTRWMLEPSVRFTTIRGNIFENSNALQQKCRHRKKRNRGALSETAPSFASARRSRT